MVFQMEMDLTLNNMWYLIFYKLVLSSLNSFIQFKHQVNINLYITKAIALPCLLFSHFDI